MANSSRNSSVLVVLPTYCEAGNIGTLLSQLLELPLKVDALVIDDDSRDGTDVEVRHTIAEYPGRVHLIRRRGKLGLGTAYVQGFQWAFARKYQIIVQMDSDLSHNPQDVARLVHKIRSGSDAVFGSRYMPGGKTENWSFFRRFLSRSANRYARWCLSVPCHDITGGFNAWRTDVLRKITPTTLDLRGYCFLIGLKYRAFRCGFRVSEIPICFRERRIGRSKMNWDIILEAAIKVPRIPSASSMPPVNATSVS